MVKIQFTPPLNLRHYFLYVERIKVWKNIKSHPNTYYQTLLLLFSSFQLVKSNFFFFKHTVIMRLCMLNKTLITTLWYIRHNIH